MRDLYALLGVARDADESELARALEGRPELASILLNSARREMYDSAHGTLRMIGSLRYRLGLDVGESWFLESCADFSPRRATLAAAQASPDATPKTAPASATPAEALAGRKPQPGGARRWAVVLVLAAVGLAAAFLLLNR